MPTLTWIGKDKVVSHHNDVPFRVLDPQYTAGTAPDSDIGQGNAIIHGDNLEALKALLPYYEGRIKCIYIDPPYNTGNENWVYNDNVNDPKIKRWLGKVVGKESEDLSRHDKWLCMMYPRLVLLHRLLADDGAIFISIDDNEQASLKLVMDEIWGMRNFVSCVIWQKKHSPQADATYFSDMHDFLIVYAKKVRLSKSSTEGFNLNKLERSDTQNDRYQNPDNDPRGTWTSDNYTCNKNSDERPNLYYPVTNPNTGNEIWPSKTSVWRYSKERHEENLRKNLVVWGADGKGRPRFKRFVESVGGIVPSTWWNREFAGDNQNARKEFRRIFTQEETDFSTPKPTLLLERILALSTNPDDIILDSFAGSGTTAHAVLNLNKQDGGDRKFVLVEMEDYAETITAERVRRVMSGYADKPGAGGSFTYYELGEPLFTDDGLLNANLPLDRIREYIWYSETRTPLPRRITSPGSVSPQTSLASAGDSSGERVCGDTDLGEQSPIPRSVSPQTSLASAGDSSGERVCEDTDLGEQSPIPRSVSPQTSLASAGDSSGERVCEDTDLGSEGGEPGETLHFLGKFNDTAYYFYYEPNALTTVDYAFMATLRTPAGQYVIYADNCLIAREWLQEHRIIFKKIPRDISRF